MTRTTLLAVMGGLTLALAAAAAPPLPARPAKYATDQAKVFDAARLAALNERLAAFERETSNQVLVYVDRRLPAGTTLEEMASAAMRAWGVGQKGKSNGVALFVFVDDRTMRIEVGYGLEGALPDAAAHRITDTVIKPHFKTRDYAGGIEAGVTAILGAVRAEANRGTGRTAAEAARPVQAAARLPGPPGPGWLFLVVAGVALVLTGARGDLLGSLGWSTTVSGAGGMIAGIFMMSSAWIVLGVVLLVVGVLGLCLLMGRRHPEWKNRPSEPGGTRPQAWWTSSGGSTDSSSSSSSDSSSDSGSSSSDFSGGGGDSGGGGSSDSW